MLSNNEHCKEKSISPLRIITMSYTCQTSHNIVDFYNIFGKLPINDRIISVAYNNNLKEMILLGKKTKNKKIKKLFYNQSTIEIKLPDNKIINCKIFMSKGRIQMSGCRHENDATFASECITNELAKIGGYDLKEDETLKLYNYRISLINSDFSINNDINLYKLTEIINSNYNLLIEFEPNDYAGAKIRYKYYQDETNFNWSVNDVKTWLEEINCKECIDVFCKNNVCGKKLLNIDHKELKNIGIDNCDIRNKIIKELLSKKFIKQITIIVFRTGKMLITGAQSLNQLNCAYKFIVDLLYNHYDELIIIT